MTVTWYLVAYPGQGRKGFPVPHAPSGIVGIGKDEQRAATSFEYVFQLVQVHMVTFSVPYQRIVDHDPAVALGNHPKGDRQAAG